MRRPCGDGDPDDGDGDRGPRSPWPFFRDLDLLRLLREAATAADRAENAVTTTEATSTPTARCRADLREYLQDLESYAPWAVQSTYRFGYHRVHDHSVGRGTAGALWRYPAGVGPCRGVEPKGVS